MLLGYFDSKTRAAAAKSAAAQPPLDSGRDSPDLCTVEYQPDPRTAPAAAAAAAAAAPVKQPATASAAAAGTACGKAVLPLYKQPVLARHMLALAGGGKLVKSLRVGPGRVGPHAVMSVALTIVGPIASDAGGNLPYAGTTAGWAAVVLNYAAIGGTAVFDVARLRKATIKLAPLFGWKTQAVLTPATPTTASPHIRIATDVDGAISTPSVTQMLELSMANSVAKPHDFLYYDGGEYVLAPLPDILRVSGSAVNRKVFNHQWSDVGDLIANSSQFCGGVIMNTLVGGSLPASTNVFGAVITVHLDLATAAV
jgi:hypothetical protein